MAGSYESLQNATVMLGNERDAYIKIKNWIVVYDGYSSGLATKRKKKKRTVSVLMGLRPSQSLRLNKSQFWDIICAMAQNAVTPHH